MNTIDYNLLSCRQELDIMRIGDYYKKILNLWDILNEDQIDRIGNHLGNTNVTKILSVNSDTCLHTENFIRDKFFPKAKLHFTDSIIENEDINKMSIRDAIAAHDLSDVLIIKNPQNDKEYVEIPYIFSGKYIFIVGQTGSFTRLEKSLECFWRRIIDIKCESSGNFNLSVIIYQNDFENLGIPVYEIFDSLKIFHLKGICEFDYTTYAYIDDVVINQLKHLWRDTIIYDILAIDVHDGKFEMALSKALFPKARINLTNYTGADITEEFRPSEAIERYSECDLMISNNPTIVDENMVEKFMGTYVIFILEMDSEDPGSPSTLPCKNMFEQLCAWGREVLSIPIRGDRYILYVFRNKFM